MNLTPRLLARIALFSALAYVLSWAATWLPNVNPIFFVIFTAGFLWGVIPGVLVGAIGMGLWTTLNPFGPATWPVMAAQILGAAMSGVVGAVVAKTFSRDWGPRRAITVLAIASVICTYSFYLPVSVVDAWVFQPFWPRFITSMASSIVALISNAIIFPLLFPATRLLYDRERNVSWQNRHSAQ